MINPDCRVLKSEDDKILKSGDDKILAQCGELPPCEFTLIVQGVMSGHVHSAGDCGDVDVSISANSDPSTVTDPECQSCSPPATVTYDDCEGVCDHPEQKVIFCAGINQFEGNWFLNLETIPFEGVMTFCQHTRTISGVNNDIPLGPDPTGVHNVSWNDFDDPNVHFDFTVTIT